MDAIPVAESQTRNSWSLKRRFLVALLLCVASVSALAAIDWRDKVIYSVEIDRFFDGDPSNSSQRGVEYDPSNPSKYSGGDLKGLSAHLDYIRDLGMDAVLINSPLSSQWWDPWSRVSGWDGTRPSDFMSVDRHFGTIDDYRSLSHGIHARGMYLLQSAVTGNVGDYFRFNSEPDPERPRESFEINTQSLPWFTPSSYPFSYNDFAHSADRDLGIYEWLRDSDAGTDLDRLDTDNPFVRRLMRIFYSFWQKEIDFDGVSLASPFALDGDFVRDFLDSDDTANPGLRRFANGCGKQDFLAIAPWPGEVFMAPDFGSDLRKVLDSGAATRVLGDRLVSLFRKGAGLPVLSLDGPGIARFPADRASTKLGLALIFTLPGVPLLYYGTEQGLAETSSSMWAGGYGSGGRDHFDESAPMFAFVRSLVDLRRSEPELRRGRIQILAQSEEAGVFAYVVADDTRSALVVLNSSEKPLLLGNAASPLPPSSELTLRFDFTQDASADAKKLFPTRLKTRIDGSLSVILPGRGIAVYSMAKPARAGILNQGPEIAPQPAYASDLGSDSTIAVIDPTVPRFGGIVKSLRTPRLAIDGDIGKSVAVIPRNDGTWTAEPDTAKLENGTHRAELYGFRQDSTLFASNAVDFELSAPFALRASLSDPIGDDRGPRSSYTYPSGRGYNHDADIRTLELSSAGSSLRVHIAMKQRPAKLWNAPEGFDHLRLFLFLNVPGTASDKSRNSVLLPRLNAAPPSGFSWNRLLIVDGWHSDLYSSEGATASVFGAEIASQIPVRIDDGGLIVDLDKVWLGDPDGLSGSSAYLAAWDYDAIADENTSLAVQAGPRSFGGGKPGDPLIMDDTKVLTIP